MAQLTQEKSIDPSITPAYTLASLEELNHFTTWSAANHQSLSDEFSLPLIFFEQQVLLAFREFESKQ